MKELIKKYESIISYGFFGICTTLINIISYYLFSHIFKFSVSKSTIIAWLVSILFAFVTNKIWVFKSKKWDNKTLIKEGTSFFVCRFLTGVLDLLIMIIFVNFMHLNDLIIKVLSNVLVIIINYIASKLIIFNNNNIYPKIKKKFSNYKHKNLFFLITIILFLLITVFIIMMQSPLNIWANSYSSIDSSVFRTIGMYMSKGFMPYKDIFDHKGPIIYIINYIGTLISFNKGIWYIEFIFMFTTFVFMYKIARLCVNKFFSCLTLFIIAISFVTFFEGGNLTEEYALPFIAISLYIFLNYFINNKVNKTGLIFCGASFAATCLLRLNMVSIWIVFSIAVLIKSIKEKKYIELRTFILYFLLGISIVVIPIFIWLIKNNAFSLFLKDYIIFNTMYVNNDVMSTTSNKIKSFLYFAQYLLVYISVIGSIYEYCRKKNIINISYLISIIFTIMLISMSGRNSNHYGMILIPLMVYPISKLLSIIENNKKKNKLPLLILGYTLLIIVLPVWKDMLVNCKSYYIQRNDNYENGIVQLIKENTSENSLITVYGNANLYYVLSNRLSASRYSYQFPVGNTNPIIFDEYFADLEQNHPEMIIVDEPMSERMSSFIENNNYKLISNNIYIINKRED